MRLRATERQLFDALRVPFPAPEYALLPQVANGTGYDAKRHADAIAMSLWPSRGLDIHGFEMKSSPSDWKRELRNPAKAEDIAKYCNFWWIVAGYPGLVKLEELPSGWGLYEYDHEKKALVKKSNAPFRVAAFDRGFLAAVMRRAGETLTPDAEIQKAYEKGLLESRNAQVHQIRTLQDSVDELKNRLKEFETASGVNIARWNAGDIGAAVNVVMSGGVTVRETRLKETCERILKELKGTDASI